jgi:hypothetical protein
VKPSNSPGGHCQKLSEEDTVYIKVIVEADPMLQLLEVQKHLLETWDIFVLLSTLSQTMGQLNFTRKQVKCKAAEQRELLHCAYINYVGKEVTLEQMIFIVESAKDNHTPLRWFQWSRHGTCPFQQTSFNRGKCYSLLPALTLDGILTYTIFEGSVTSDWFLLFIQDYVVSPIHHFD